MAGERDTIGDMSRTSVLIVDDHESFRVAARTLLEQAAFRVVGDAPDGRSGLAAADRLRPDVVLLDIRLPDLDGYEVARRLRGDRPRPVVVLTSTLDAADVGPRAISSGACGFVTKSRLSGDTLRRLLARAEREAERS